MARLPNVERDQLEPKDQKYFDEISGSRGSIRGPYGILLHSPDVAARVAHTGAYDLLPTGALALGTGRVFADLKGERPGVPDGMKVDVEGNVYCGGSGGV